MHESPAWWNDELILSPHLVERMQERRFSEVDLRIMLDEASGYRPSVMPGRFVITTSRQREHWEIVVEPDEVERILIVVTAYPVE